MRTLRFDLENHRAITGRKNVQGLTSSQPNEVKSMTHGTDAHRKQVESGVHDIRTDVVLERLQVHATLKVAHSWPVGSVSDFGLGNTMTKQISNFLLRGAVEGCTRVDDPVSNGTYW